MECFSFRLVCTSGLWPTQAGHGLRLDPLFFPCSEHRAGSIRVLDDGSDLWGWPSALLWDACVSPAPAPEFIFGVTVLASVSFSLCRLQFVVRDAISLTGGFLGVLDVLALLACWIICSGSVSRTLLRAQLRAYLTSLRKDTHITDLVLLLLYVIILVSG